MASEQTFDAKGAHVATDGFNPLDWLAALPGVILAGGALMRHGALNQRVHNLEKAVTDYAKQTSEISELVQKVTRVEERISNTTAIAARCEAKLDQIVADMLAEARRLIEHGGRPHG